MSRRARIVFLALVAAQTLFPVGVVAWNEIELARGTDVVLRTAPVDPYDPFRGRYVTLRYEISNVRVEKDVEPGETVYVPLTKAGDHWMGGVATTERPERGTFIRGRVRSTFGRPRGVGGMAEIAYGIETYYAEEDEAKRLEREVARGLDVEVDLDDDGKARIENLDVRN